MCMSPLKCHRLIRCTGLELHCIQARHLVRAGSLCQRLADVRVAGQVVEAVEEGHQDGRTGRLAVERKPGHHHSCAIYMYVEYCRHII